MMQSLYTASTGMLGMQAQIDTTANNIANVNTIGFKKSRAEFSDLMYSVMKYAGTSTSDVTKTPTGIEIGLGVRSTAINKIFAEGSNRLIMNLTLPLQDVVFLNLSFLMEQRFILKMVHLRLTKMEL